MSRPDVAQVGQHSVKACLAAGVYPRPLKHAAV
jgi:hypothetical protein